ncbi:MAG: DUF4127 family protein [bacterium]
MKFTIRNFTAIVFMMIFSFGFSAMPSSATEPVIIKALTLDNRPPNNLMLKELAAIAGIDLYVSFDPETAPSADLVSLNASVAGSLVGSRSVDPWKLVPPILKPDALIHFAFPRVEPTVSESAIISEYGRVRQELNKPDTQRTVLKAIFDETVPIDDEYLAGYVERIQGWLDFLNRAKYDPDRLLITLDDNRPGPLADGLKLELGKYSRHVRDGTDEGMMMLLARALRERQSDSPNTCVIAWTDPADLTSIQPFESSLIAENVFSMADWLGLKISPKTELYENWRPVLWIHGPGSDEASRPEKIINVSESLGERTVVVADIAKANGGDPILFDTWREGHTPKGLIGYVGWNTSSNTLGSAFSLWATIDFAYEHGADPTRVRSAIETFLWARILDDYFYQRIVRSERTDLIRSEGADPYKLDEKLSSREAHEIAERLTQLWSENEVSLAIPLRIVDTLGDTTFTVELPWNRLFEIALYPSDWRGILPVIKPVEKNGSG